MLGKRIAKLRKSKGLSQYELSERLGFSRGKLANYEQGSRQPDYETLQQIADYFDVTTDYLLGRTDNPNPDKNNDEEEFQKFINDPELERWHRELPKSDEEDLKKLKKMWDIIKSKDK